MKKRVQLDFGGTTRREILKIGAAGMGLALLGPMGRTAWASPVSSGNCRVILINCLGGNDGLNTVIPVSLASYYSRRPTLAIPSSSALSMAGGPGNSNYKLHPNLGNMKTMWDDGDMAVIQRVGYPDPNLSHFTSQDIWEKASGDPNTMPKGWVASYCDLFTTTPTSAILMGLENRKSFVGAQTTRPLTIKDVDNFTFNDDSQYPNDDIRRKALAESFQTGKSGNEKTIGEAFEQGFDLADTVQSAVSSYTSTVSYPSDGFAGKLKDIAKLIQAGFDTKIFYTGLGGFDTHANQLDTHGALLTRINNGLKAFVDDIKAMGEWNKTVIAVFSEFGRRNFENGTDGTDHGFANCVLLFGGSVTGGMYGDDIQENDLLLDNLTYTTDFRNLYKILLEKPLGVSNSDDVLTAPYTKNSSLLPIIGSC